jgi:archaellum component FlaC
MLTFITSIKSAVDYIQSKDSINKQGTWNNASLSENAQAVRVGAQYALDLIQDISSLVNPPGAYQDRSTNKIKAASLQDQAKDLLNEAKSAEKGVNDLAKTFEVQAFEFNPSSKEFKLQEDVDDLARRIQLFVDRDLGAFAFYWILLNEEQDRLPFHPEGSDERKYLEYTFGSRRID